MQGEELYDFHCKICGCDFKKHISIVYTITKHGNKGTIKGKMPKKILIDTDSRASPVEQVRPNWDL